MPELPDVEEFRRVVERHVVGKRIDRVEVQDAGVLRGVTGSSFTRRLRGRRVVGTDRRGKWLIVHFDGPVLLVHFGMTGGFFFEAAADDRDRFDRVTFDVDKGVLAYRDQRKLRGLWLTDDNSLDEIIGKQGPDALEIDRDQLAARLESSRRSLKIALMDQKVVAGLGNMLSDEILWRSRINPARRYAELSVQERRALERSLRQTLRQAVRHGSIPRTPRWLSSQRGSDDPRCPRCHGELRTTKIDGRTSYWCPTCQPPR